MKEAVKIKLIIHILVIFIISIVADFSCYAAKGRTVFTEIAEEKYEFACFSAKEKEIFELINQYRLRNGLPSIPSSRSLSKVARMHAVDLNKNKPDRSLDSRGLPCTLHSWSSSGFWSPVCYTSDHYYLSKMVSKPAEITRRGYDDPAYENVYWSSEDVIFPKRVVQAWEDSASHRELVLEQNRWAKSYWKAMGVGVYNNIVTIWVGSMPDPLGPMKECVYVRDAAAPPK